MVLKTYFAFVRRNKHGFEPIQLINDIPEREAYELAKASNLFLVSLSEAQYQIAKSLLNLKQAD